MAMNDTSHAEAPDRRARAVFLDKDGTLIEDIPYNVDPSKVELLPRVGEGLRELQDAGYMLIVCSNQPGVALQRFAANALDAIEARVDELLEPFGVVITEYCWCTHHPVGVRAAGYAACTCRKPRPGLLLNAAAAHNVDLARSWMVGDILDDVEAGMRAGCNTILVDRGHETRWRGGRMRTPRAIVYDFADAVSFIVDGPRSARVSKARAAPG